MTLRSIGRALGLMTLGIVQMATPAGADPAPTTQPSTTVQNTATAPPAPATLNTGRDINAGMTSIPLGQFPLGAVPTADHRHALICAMGYRDALLAVDTADGHVTGKVEFSTSVPTHIQTNTGVENNDSDTADVKTNGLYYGVAVSGNTVYAAQGAHDSIAVFSLSDKGELALTGTIKTRENDFPAGVAVDAGGRVYVTNNVSGTGYGEPGSVAIYDPKARSELGRVVFDSDTHTSNFMLAIAVMRDGHKTYAASERDGVVFAIDSSEPFKPRVIKAIATGANPDAMLLNRDQTRLFVANGKSDTVSVIDTQTDAMVGTVLLRPGTARGLAGVTPTALCLSPDEKTLYVALADLNAVGVVDTAGLTLSGMIPTGWYPTGVLATDDHRLLVVNAKGVHARNPNPKYNPTTRDTVRDNYILNKIHGDLIVLGIPTVPQLAEQTLAVIRNSHLSAEPADAVNPLGAIGLAAGKIKHVIYIIKENRTYDQILGDDPRGNGDPSLTLFGKNVTPNLHALADRFVLLDNFYACGEVSGDGWTWSTQSTANAYVERNIPYNYSGRGRDYDFEGTNNGYINDGFPATDADGKPTSKDPQFKDGGKPVPDVAGNVRIWDMAKAAGISYRNYGFFITGGTETSLPKYYPTVKNLQPPGHDLAGLTDADFINFDLDFPDSDAPAMWFARTQDKDCLYAKKPFGKYKATSRFGEWDREFKQMLARDAGGDAVPALMFVRLPHDHTQGMSRRKHSPASEVADNDFGVAQLVEAVSHSPIWTSTAIFVVEDDAQNGADHIDAHRTTAYIISPWIKRGSVDHQFANTDSLLKTMENLLGLPPMSQYDAIARPIMDFDTGPTNAEPYEAVLPPKAVIAEINGISLLNGAIHVQADRDAIEQLMGDSDRMNFTHADAAPADRLNQIIWASVRGPRAVMPPPRHSAVSPILGTITSKSFGKDSDGDDDGD